MLSPTFYGASISRVCALCSGQGKLECVRACVDEIKKVVSVEPQVEHLEKEMLLQRGSDF